jgi:alkanesulfonate monooxygenase SsuD/methylene tetrahydromethanopterin reductase-like flavin-dependent oxidoreductase (luciferase family)
MGSHATDPQPYAAVREFSLHAERLGFDAIYAFDHVLFRFEGQPERGALEAWTTLAMLGEATSTIGLGALVLGVRMRNPALLAKSAETLDAATGGRLTLGIGAGWHDPEYTAFGYPIDHRLGRTDEALGLIRRLLDGERVSYDGRWIQTDEAVLLPPPTRRIPILSSSKMGRMARIVARHADAWNGAWFATPDDPELVARREELMRACDEVGRDPAEIGLTVGVSIRYADADEPSPTRGRGDVEGDAGLVAERLAAFADAGFDEAMAWLGPMDVRGLDRLAEAVEIWRR